MSDEPTRLHADADTPASLRELLQWARTDGLSAAAVDRIRDGLMRAATTATPSVVATRGGWLWTVGTVATAGIVAALFLGREPEPDMAVAMPNQNVMVSSSDPAVVVAPVDVRSVEVRGALPSPITSERDGGPSKKKRVSSESSREPVTVANPAATHAAAEAQLLLRARRALSRDPSRTLALTETHRRDFPEGTLAQERESLAIFALQQLGRISEAHARARSFARRFPGSPHQTAIRRALAEHEPPDTKPP